MPDVVKIGFTLLLKNIRLVVSRLFAGDNRLSPDILLVTTGCQQTKKSSDNRLSADLALKKCVALKPRSRLIRPLVKCVYQKFIFLISQLKHMLWVLKRIVSMRWFF